MTAQESPPGKSVQPAAAIAYARIAKQLRKLGETALALSVLEKALSRFPNNSAVHMARAETFITRYNKKGRPDDLKAALGSLEKTLKLDPGNYLAKLLSSQIYLKAGARKRAKALLTDILETAPDDERAVSLMNIVREKEEKAAAKEAVKKEETQEGETEELGEEGAGEVIIDQALRAEVEKAPRAAAPAMDEKVIIGGEEEAEDLHAQEAMSAKLTIFSRLEGLNALFLLDRNGQPIKIINRAGLDENIIPSFVFNLYKTSMNATRRLGNGSFQRGTLVSPIGTIIIANAFYATIAVVVDNDANLSAVEKRIQRYLEEVAG
ncbi:MAG: tetratricopeptide repeat protein [Candidatus Nitrospinota bacterium M3_3B_026]